MPQSSDELLEARYGLARDKARGILTLKIEDMVRCLAEEFGVTPAAMRVRLQQMKIIAG